MLDWVFRRDLGRGRIGAGDEARAKEQTVLTTATAAVPHPRWPPGFIERTAGAWQGEPPVRPPQGECEERDPVE